MVAGALALVVRGLVAVVIGWPGGALVAEPPVSATIARLTSEEAQLATLLDAARGASGAPALAVEPTVQALARERAYDMASRRYFGHITPGGETVLTMLLERGINYQYAGETLQMNNYPAAETVAEAYRSLMASPPHHAILLDRRFSHVGVGHAADGALHYFAIILVQFDGLDLIRGDGQAQGAGGQHTMDDDLGVLQHDPVHDHLERLLPLEQ